MFHYCRLDSGTCTVLESQVIDDYLESLGTVAKEAEL